MLYLCNFLIDSDEKSTVIVLFFEIGGNDRDIFINAAQIYIMRREILCLKMLTFMDI